MLIKPQNYASALIQALEEKKNAKEVAKNFLKIIQKNKQHKNLPSILNALDDEYARQNKMKLIRVTSDEVLKSDQKSDIETTLEKKYGKDIVIDYTTKPNIAGIIIKADDGLTDLSLTGKIKKLKKQFNKK